MLQSLRHKIYLVASLYASIVLLSFMVLFWLHSEQGKYLKQQQNIPDVVEVSFQLNNAIQRAAMAQQTWLLSSEVSFQEVRKSTWKDHILPAFDEMSQLYKERVQAKERSVERRAFYDLRLMVLELERVQKRIEVDSQNLPREEILTLWKNKEQPLVQQISGEFEFLIRWQSNYARHKFDELQLKIFNIGIWTQGIAFIVILLVMVLAAYFAKLIMNPLRDMSHELRTPLNAIINFTEILLESDEEEQLSDYQSDRLRRILRSGRHLLDLISTLLDLSKVDAGQMQVTHSEFNLEHLLQDVVDWLEPLMQEKSIIYETIYQTSPPFPISSDAGKIRQIIINLLGNSIKFTENEGRISTIIFQDQNSVSIHIQDNGCGIPKNQHKRIFGVFHQVSGTDTKSETGSGLGLALVQNLTKLLGGSITLESEVGKGSLFKLNFPKNAT